MRQLPLLRHTYIHSAGGEQEGAGAKFIFPFVLLLSYLLFFYELKNKSAHTHTTDRSSPLKCVAFIGAIRFSRMCEYRVLARMTTLLIFV